MRSREQIETLAGNRAPDGAENQRDAILEALLDIRQLLANPHLQQDFGEARDLLTNDKQS